MVGDADRCASTSDAIGCPHEEGNVGGRQLHRLHPRGITHQEAEVSGAHHMPKEHLRGFSLLAQNSGHVRAGVQEHTNVRTTSLWWAKNLMGCGRPSSVT